FAGRDGRGVHLLVRGQVVDVKKSVLRRSRNNALAALGGDEYRRGGEIPVVKISRHQRVVIAIDAGLGVEHQNGIRVEVVTAANLATAVGTGIAGRNIKKAARGIDTIL